MKLRAPAVPLINVDPFFSIWSMNDHLTDEDTKHWTGKPNPLVGLVEIDGKTYKFMGATPAYPSLTQTNLEIKTLSTQYTFEGAGIRLIVNFMTPLLQKNYEVMTRPVSYIHATFQSLDQASHSVHITLKAFEHLCLNTPGEMPVQSEILTLDNHITATKMGSEKQPVLASSGDDHRINWGYLYLCAPHAKGDSGVENGHTFISVTTSLEASSPEALFTLAYDDIASMVYFSKQLKSYWNKDGETIETAILKAYKEYPVLTSEADAFHDRLVKDATQAGGEKYAELLVLAYRQVMSAHKLVCDTDGQILYISKECFSNGCAATVDVSYPSIPMYLHYDTELIKGMMRPIFKYANGDVWPFNFAPHDAGTYPHVNGQVYANGTDPEHQMPVEECGNMLIMAAAITKYDQDASFALEHIVLLNQWANYLIRYGLDPNNQLCTDDFAGHLAHNCNLSVKAILGIASMGIIYSYLNKPEEAKKYLATAQAMAQEWIHLAINQDGSYRLAFDQPNTYSMKYNLVWDKLFETNLFPAEIIEAELQSYPAHMKRYGMPLDNRESYTKSDWLVWTATLSSDQTYFESFIAPLWDFYNESPSRVPMTDWYQTTTGTQVGFQHRTVQGGLFIKLI